MRSVGVVVDPPCLDDLAGLVEVGEQMFVQALVPQSAVEALDEAMPRLTMRARSLNRSGRALETSFAVPTTTSQSSELGAGQSSGTPPGGNLPLC